MNFKLLVYPFLCCTYRRDRVNRPHVLSAHEVSHNDHSHGDLEELPEVVASSDVAATAKCEVLIEPNPADEGIKVSDFENLESEREILIPYIVDYPLNRVIQDEELTRDQAARLLLDDCGFFGASGPQELRSTRDVHLVTSVEKKRPAKKEEQPVGDTGPVAAPKEQEIPPAFQDYQDATPKDVKIKRPLEFSSDLTSYDLALDTGSPVWHSLATKSLHESASKVDIANDNEYKLKSAEDAEAIRKKYVIGRARIHWFPRYFHKSLSDLYEWIEKVDIILDVRDARIPYVSDSDFLINVYNNMFTHKPKILVYTHKDQASVRGCEDWARYYRIKEFRNYKLFNKNIENENEQKPFAPCVFVNGRLGGKSLITLKKLIYKMCARVNERRIRKGFEKRPLRAIVLGLPNIGKSALINRLIGRRKSDSYNSPGVTREIKWVRLRPDEYTEAVHKIIDCVDTPGILPPNLYHLCDMAKGKNKLLGRLYYDLEDNIPGGYSKSGIDAKSQKIERNVFLLAAANQIIEGAYDNSEAAQILMEQMFQTFSKNPSYIDMARITKRFPFMRRYLDILKTRTHREHLFEDLAYDFLDTLAVRNFAGESNAAASRILTDFRKGYIGSSTLQVPPPIEVFEEFTQSKQQVKISAEACKSPIPSTAPEYTEYSHGLYYGW